MANIPKPWLPEQSALAILRHNIRVWRDHGLNSAQIRGMVDPKYWEPLGLRNRRLMYPQEYKALKQSWERLKLEDSHETIRVRDLCRAAGLKTNWLSLHRNECARLGILYHEVLAHNRAVSAGRCNLSPDRRIDEEGDRLTIVWAQFDKLKQHGGHITLAALSEACGRSRRWLTNAGWKSQNYRDLRAAVEAHNAECEQRHSA